MQEVKNKNKQLKYENTPLKNTGLGILLKDSFLQ